MSEDPKKPAEDEKKKISDELSNKDLDQVTGGVDYGTIKGDVTSDQHQKWIDTSGLPK